MPVMLHIALPDKSLYSLSQFTNYKRIAIGGEHVIISQILPRHVHFGSPRWPSLSINLELP
jgi:hypothetical protein